MVIGWSAPALVLILYGTLRGFVADEEDRQMYVEHKIIIKF